MLSEAKNLQRALYLMEVDTALELVRDSEFFQGIIETGVVPREIDRAYYTVTKVPDILADVACVLRHTGDERHMDLAAEAYRRVKPFVRSRTYLTRRPWNRELQPSAHTVNNAADSYLFSLTATGNPVEALCEGYSYFAHMSGKVEGWDLVAVYQTYLKTAFKARRTIERSKIRFHGCVSTWNVLREESAEYLRLVGELTDRDQDHWWYIEAQVLNCMACLKWQKTEAKMAAVQRWLERAQEVHGEKMGRCIEGWKSFLASV